MKRQKERRGQMATKFRIGKERKLRLLKLLKVEYEKFNTAGLCDAVASLYYDNEKMMWSEAQFLLDLIKAKRPKGKRISPYYWAKYELEPRIIWINKRIKELEGKC